MGCFSWWSLCAVVGWRARRLFGGRFAVGVSASGARCGVSVFVFCVGFSPTLLPRLRRGGARSLVQVTGQSDVHRAMANAQTGLDEALNTEFPSEKKYLRLEKRDYGILIYKL